MKMLWNEIKKIMQMKNIYIYTAVVLAVTLFFAGYCVSVSRAENVSDDGNVTIVNGSAAISIQKNIDRPLSGQVTEEKLKNALQIVQRHYDKITDEFIYDQEFLNCQRLFGLLNEINYVYPEFNEKTYDSVDEMPQSLAGSYYAVRLEKINKMINAFYTSNKQKQVAKKMSADVTIPFTYNVGYGFWNAAMDYYTILLVVVLIAAALIASTIFAEDYHSGADLVFRTTKYGRRELGLSRVMAAELYGIFLFIMASVLFFGICMYFFGVQGLDSSIQMMTTYAISDMKYYEILICAICGGLISIIGTVGIVVFFSAKVNHPIISVVISISFILIWKAAAMLFSSSPGSAFRLFLMAFPMSGTEMIHSLTSLSIFQLFNINLWEPYWIIFTGMMIGIIFSFLAVYTYAKKKN